MSARAACGGRRGCRKYSAGRSGLEVVNTFRNVHWRLAPRAVVPSGAVTACGGPAAYVSGFLAASADPCLRRPVAEVYGRIDDLSIVSSLYRTVISPEHRTVSPCGSYPRQGYRR